MKKWRTRLQETWDRIDGIHGVPVGKVNALKIYHNGMTDPEKKLVSEAMAQGAYTHGKPGIFTRGNARDQMQQDRKTEKVRRAYRRAMILIFMANHASGNVQNDLNAALQAVPPNVTGEAVHRVKAELMNLNQAILQMKAGGQVRDFNWNGWDGTRQRPLLAGCSIGRRGAKGPGTLGCFVTIGLDVFILSNRHVLQQAGEGGLVDAEIIQPPHQLGGSYYDDVATFHADFPNHDAAIVKVKSGIWCNNTTVQGTAILGSAVATLNGVVKKSGCATGERCGQISNIIAPAVQTQNIQLIHQLLIQRDDILDLLPNETFQMKGDSGSVVLDNNNMVVALLHGQVGATVAQGTHIAPILMNFNAAVLVGNQQAP